MKKSLPKTIFFTLFYLALAYLTLLLAFIVVDYYYQFEVESNFDAVNHTCLAVASIGVWLFAVVFFTLALLFPFQYIKSLKERGDY